MEENECTRKIVKQFYLEINKLRKINWKKQ